MSGSKCFHDFALDSEHPDRLGQVPEHDRRFGQPELRGGKHPAMACDQFAVVRD